VKNAILKLAAMDENERKAMGEKGREYALRELNYENLSKKFISFLKSQ
jgi:glycosyltransferase involved in cell wall biosynthesis